MVRLIHLNQRCKCGNIKPVIAGLVELDGSSINQQEWRLSLPVGNGSTQRSQRVTQVIAGRLLRRNGTADLPHLPARDLQHDHVALHLVIGNGQRPTRTLDGSETEGETQVAISATDPAGNTGSLLRL